MQNPLSAAVETFLTQREIRKVERIRKLARKKRAEADQLDGIVSPVRSRSANGSYSQNEPEKQKTEGPRREPYDFASSGPVRLDMWYGEQSREFAFQLLWEVMNGGRPKYRRSVSVKLFDDVIRALADLASKYQTESRLPKATQTRMSLYAEYLYNLPDVVGLKALEQNGPRARANGSDRQSS